MSFVEKVYQLQTVGQIIDLWTNNAEFKKLVGPTVIHIGKWLKELGYATLRSNTIKSLNASITFDMSNELELLLCDYNNALLTDEFKRKHAYEYIESYMFEGVLNLNYLITNCVKSRPLTIYIGNYIIDYIIDNKIRLENESIDVNNHIIERMITIDKLDKLFELGLVIKKSDISKFVAYYNNHDVLSMDSERRKKYGFNHIIDIFTNMYNMSASLRLYYEVFLSYKNNDDMWTPVLDEHNKTIVAKFVNIIANRHKITDEYTFAVNMYLINGVIQFFDMTYFLSNIIEIVEKEKVDINQKCSNNSYLIQFFFQRHDITSVNKLLDMGAKILDDDGSLLKGESEKTIVEFNPATVYESKYKYSYDILMNYYKADEEMLEKINNAYKIYIQSDSSLGITIKLMEPVFTDNDQIKGMYDQITDQRLKDKLLAYHAKQLLKKKN